MKIWHTVSRRFQWLGYSGLLLIVIVGFLSYKYEDFKEEFPRLITWQLRTYQWINHPSHDRSRKARITPIEIDDKTFYDFLGNQTRNEFTDRTYLAKLVEAATNAKAAVIALDINLDSSHPAKSADAANPLSDDDRALLVAVLHAQEAQIPVVLTFGFRPDKKPVPQLFDDLEIYKGLGISYQFPEDEQPPRPYFVPRFGFDHPGDDYRKVPLITAGYDDSGNRVDYYSFALQATDAFEQRSGTARERTVKNVLQKTLAEHEFVYASFLPVSEFIQPKTATTGEPSGALSALEVVCNPAPGKDWSTIVCGQRDPDRVKVARELLAGHIVLIGGNRHGNRGETGEEDYLDDRESPVGRLRGMYMQANYIEGLLDNRILFKVTPRAAAIIDALLAAFVLWIVHLLKGIVRAAIVIVVFFVPVIIAYVGAALFNYCIDFVFPLVLLLLHPALESYIHLFFHHHHVDEVVHEHE